MWNDSSLKCPPVAYFTTKSSSININNVVNIVSNGIQTFGPEIQNILKIESALLRRVIYRNKLQLRNDKGFKLMETTNRFLNKLISFNISQILVPFLDSMPKMYKKDFVLPSRQSLEFILLRLQCYSQLCCHVVEMALNTAKLMNSRIALGHIWQVALVVLAICSRIWKVVKHLLMKCCHLYDELFPLRNKLEIVGKRLIPDSYEFPKDLLTWLDIDWFYDTPEVVAQLSVDLPIFSLLEEEDEDDDAVKFCGEYNLNDFIVIDDEPSESVDTSNDFCENYKPIVLDYQKGTKRKLEDRNESIISIQESDSDEDLIYSELILDDDANKVNDLISISDDAAEERSFISLVKNENKRKKIKKDTEEDTKLNMSAKIIEINDTADIIINSDSENDVCSQESETELNSNKIEPINLNDIGEVIPREKFDEAFKNLDDFDKNKPVISNTKRKKRKKKNKENQIELNLGESTSKNATVKNEMTPKNIPKKEKGTSKNATVKNEVTPKNIPKKEKGTPKNVTVKNEITPKNIHKVKNETPKNVTAENNITPKNISKKKKKKKKKTPKNETNKNEITPTNVTVQRVEIPQNIVVIDKISPKNMIFTKRIPKPVFAKNELIPKNSTVTRQLIPINITHENRRILKKSFVKREVIPIHITGRNELIPTNATIRRELIPINIKTEIVQENVIVKKEINSENGIVKKEINPENVIVKKEVNPKNIIMKKEIIPENVIVKKEMYFENVLPINYNP